MNLFEVTTLQSDKLLVFKKSIISGKISDVNLVKYSLGYDTRFGHPNKKWSTFVTNEEVNIEFLYYYLKLNMKIVNNNVPFIKIEPIKVDPKWIESIRELYHSLIESIDNKIQKLFNKNREYLFNKMDMLNKQEPSSFYKITNKELFFRNLSKGNFNNSDEYMQIRRPDLLDGETILYYLYYTDELSNPFNYYHTERGMEDFHGKYIYVYLVGNIVEHMKPIHEKILKLRVKRKTNKLILRKLINNIIHTN